MHCFILKSKIIIQFELKQKITIQLYYGQFIQSKNTNKHIIWKKKKIWKKNPILNLNTQKRRNFHEKKKKKKKGGGGGGGGEGGGGGGGEGGGGGGGERGGGGGGGKGGGGGGINCLSQIYLIINIFLQRMFVSNFKNKMKWRGE
uniref:Uncharacterized protein n=1 Tax=Cacopsylla melanoneura TaxID=428564 RepID=A0A8D8QTH0_9HEMI